MSTPTIPAGNLYMNATLWVGTGAAQTIVNGAPGASFQPDFVWFKNRSGTWNNSLVNSITGGTQSLVSNATDAQTTDNLITAFNSNGFTLGVSGNANNSGNNIVGWQWKAGGTAVSNTAGSITSQVSANTTSGFSIVTYTGNGSGSAQTIGHGLGVVPSMMAFKNRTNASDWEVYHVSLGATQGMHFNNTTAAASINWFNNTAPTSSVATINGTGNEINQSGSNYVAYMWAPVAGYSQFGSYTGNGSADGPFIYTGFRPRFIILKVYSSGDTSDWRMYDTSRDTYNLAQNKLYANLSNAENSNGGETSATNDMDILSNGLKLRTSNTGTNNSGSTYIYAAFAEVPFKFANGR